MNIIYSYTIYLDRGKTALNRKIRENFRLGRGIQTSYQRSWKNSLLEKRNIRENTCQ
jgi:hypothetical protein